MSANTNIALAAALILGTASAALATDAGKSAGRARESYAQVAPSPKGDPNPSTVPTRAVRPLTQFEKTWFDYQDHE